jgi:hypothetical protein
MHFVEVSILLHLLILLFFQETLILCDNHIGDPGGLALADALRMQPPPSMEQRASTVVELADDEVWPCSVTHLDLQNNRLTDDSALALAETLAHVCVLK